jgi:predicted GNAT family acetyltransferase
MELKHGDHKIFIENESKKLLAKITFPACEDGVVDIDHTFVDDSLRGQGIADKLMRAAITQIRESNLKAKVTCPYAKSWFKKHPEQSDLLIED